MSSVASVFANAWESPNVPTAAYTSIMGTSDLP
jgi:hypothetical protein